MYLICTNFGSKTKCGLYCKNAQIQAPDKKIGYIYVYNYNVSKNFKLNKGTKARTTTIAL